MQYLVYCLDKEKVCHHITVIDKPPGEMKETFFIRHNQTVLPLLANNKKDTLQAIHISFVICRAIDNMTDNKVLNNQPPPINDEETHLSRRQWATLSRLRCEHCKLLYSYQKAVTCEFLGQASLDDTGTELS